MEDHVQNNEKVIAEVKLELKSLEERAFQTLAGLQGQLDEKEAATINIDSIGLLPILSGIVLTGVPEELSHRGVWGWLILGGGCYLTGNAIYRIKKSGAWSGKLS